MDRRAFVQHSSSALAALTFAQWAKPSLVHAADTATGASKVVTYAYARGVPRSPVFKVWVKGQEQVAFQTSCGAFVAFGSDGDVDVEVELPASAQNVRIAPARFGVVVEKTGARLRFRMPRGAKLLIEIDQLPHLFLFANPIDSAAADPTAAGVHYFKAGQIYEVGVLQLAENETLYIEGGAVVRGCVRSSSSKNVRIAGQGVLDGSYYQKGGEHRRSVVLEGCRDSRIDDIIMIEPSSWMLMLGDCENITINNIKQLGFVAGSDGVDIVGSRHIRVQNSFHRNGDDCIAIKSLDLRPHEKNTTLDYTKDVEDIEVSGCSFMAFLGGQAMEIGHELRCDSVKNIRFRDCDVLKKPNYGAPFSIHNADHAVVSDVSFENIRVEHHYDKLVDFRIIESRWSKDKERGQIRNIALRNIEVVVSPYNTGYTLSVIGGFDAKHKVSGVTFDNFRLNGKRVTTEDALDLYLRHADKVSFR